MSTSEQEKYVTKEYLEAFMGAALQANNEMQEQQMKAQFASFMSAFESKLSPLVGQVNEITAAINQAQQQAPPAAVQQQKFTVPDLVNLVRESAGAFKDVKSAYEGEPSSPIDPKLETIYKANMANLFNRGMKVTTNAITRLLNKEINSELSGPVTKQIARDIVGGTHEPIL